MSNPIKPVNQIILNGEPRETKAGDTVRALLAELNLTADKVAVELNKRLLRTESYDRPLADGDEVEIVTFVGGG